VTGHYVTHNLGILLQQIKSHFFGTINYYFNSSKTWKIFKVLLSMHNSKLY